MNPDIERTALRLSKIATAALDSKAGVGARAFERTWPTLLQLAEQGICGYPLRCAAVHAADVSSVFISRGIGCRAVAGTPENGVVTLQLSW